MARTRSYAGVWLVYNVLAYLLLAPLFCAALLCRGFRERRYWRNFGERFGFGKISITPGIWVHAASVGEVQSAAALLRRLRDRYPQFHLVMTTVTPTGRERARVLFGSIAQVLYLPIDLPGAVRRFLDRARPSLAIILETELWPNLYREVGRRQIPIVIASARLSARSARHYRLAARLFKATLAHATIVAAQAAADAERFRSIGADPARIHVIGNLKFDAPSAPEVAARGALLREYHAAQRNVWIAGSTHGGEEAIVLHAHRLLRRSRPDLLLILAPRHPNRFGQVADWLAREGVRTVRHSQRVACTGATEVLLLDTLGELPEFYAAADVAFVGGSLVPVGGHNLLEPAAVGRPILTGPYNFNGAAVARLLVSRGVVRIVHSASGLSRAVRALLDDSQACARVGALARTLVEDNRGTADALMRLIAPFLGSSVSTASPAWEPQSQAVHELP